MKSKSVNCKANASPFRIPVNANNLNSAISSKASNESTDSVPEDKTASTSETESSDDESIPVSDVDETNEYDPTTEVGTYSVSTEDMNAVKIFSWNLDAINKREKFSLKLNNKTGTGTLIEHGGKGAEVKIHYQEIKTKKIMVAGRTVKVNTILLTNDDSPRYVFKNNSGSVSIAKVVTDPVIPHPFYVEAKAE